MQNTTICPFTKTHRTTPHGSILALHLESASVRFGRFLQAAAQRGCELAQAKDDSFPSAPRIMVILQTGASSIAPMESCRVSTLIVTTMAVFVTSCLGLLSQSGQKGDDVIDHQRAIDDSHSGALFGLLHPWRMSLPCDNARERLRDARRSLGCCLSTGMIRYARLAKCVWTVSKNGWK